MSRSLEENKAFYCKPLITSARSFLAIVNSSNYSKSLRPHIKISCDDWIAVWKIYSSRRINLSKINYGASGKIFESYLLTMSFFLILIFQLHTCRKTSLNSQMLCTDGDMLCNYHININIFLPDCKCSWKLGGLLIQAWSCGSANKFRKVFLPS